jgi:hypothetical protein
VKPEQKIDEAYERDAAERPRLYIGASIAGNPCDAYLALSMRGFPDDQPHPRLRRIFRLGHVVEDEVIADLKKAGFDVLERDQITGKQFEFKAYGGHVSSHADGIIDMGDLGPWLLEVKTMNADKWTKFKEMGVKISHPLYFSQMQTMMGLSGMRKALFIAYNKNTSEYATEEVEFDEFYWFAIKARIEQIMAGNAKRIGAAPDDWRCKGCFKRSACWGVKAPEIMCPTCAHAVPDIMSNGWVCAKHGRMATTPCADHTPYTPKAKT